jgi:rubrerythrin
MENKEKEWVCAHCGYTASGKFVGDICPQCNQTYWKCPKCGLLITASHHSGNAAGHLSFVRREM